MWWGEGNIVAGTCPGRSYREEVHDRRETTEEKLGEESRSRGDSSSKGLMGFAFQPNYQTTTKAKEKRVMATPK